MEIHGCSRNFWNRWQNIVTWDDRVSSFHKVPMIVVKEGKRRRRSEREIYVSELYFMPLFLYSQFFYVLSFSPRSSSLVLFLFLCTLFLVKCSKVFFVVHMWTFFYCRNYRLHFLICFLIFFLLDSFTVEQWKILHMWVIP